MSVETDMTDLYSAYLRGLREPTQEQAAQVLAVLDCDTGAPRPPEFLDLLIATMSEATLDQLQRLASGYPGYARAVHMLRHEYDGAERLRTIATGRERVDVAAVRAGEQPAITMLTTPGEPTPVDVDALHDNAPWCEHHQDRPDRGCLECEGLTAECGCPAAVHGLGYAVAHLGDCPDRQEARGA